MGGMAKRSAAMLTETMPEPSCVMHPNRERAPSRPFLGEVPVYNPFECALFEFDRDTRRAITSDLERSLSVARRKRRRRNGGTFFTILFLSGVVLTSWWVVLRPTLPALPSIGQAIQWFPLLSAQASTMEDPPPSNGDTSARGAQDAATPASPTSGSTAPRPVPSGSPTAAGPAPAPPIVSPSKADSRGSSQGIRELITTGRSALARGDLLAARPRLNQALQLSADDAEQTELRADLARIAAETVLSGQVFPDDPLTGRYIIQVGDTLEKIASANKIPLELLAQVNRVVDKNRIRAGQTLKVIHGPFRAIVDTRKFRLELLLGDVFVKEYRVGLGVDDSTPRGDWRVGTKLVNPTYYPPRGGTIVQADDPQNPLGERWIALEGVSGEAVGQERYGLHGTNDPSTIGKNQSMGCIRMANEDAEEVYAFLVQQLSTVTVR